MTSKEHALEYHCRERAGKLEVRPTKPCTTQLDLSLAYTPGVAQPCLEIVRNPGDVYRYTAKGNLVAVVSNGSAVLGLGNIGAEASKPVMEGKGVLFKRFADIDVFDIELNTQDPREIIRCCQLLEPTFGGINLEDIKAPECFTIEQTLKETMGIPVFHDDQHGTAIISGAALLNALELVKKDIAKVRVVFSGAGAAGIACAKFYFALGVDPKNILMVDSKGVLYEGREEYQEYKKRFARRTDARSLADALEDADVFVGVSIANSVTREMVSSMARDPIVFAMANPDPEISYQDAVASRPDAIVATGRSDFPNQVNNVLGFPFIFRGALDVQATAINENMKIAAAYALADLAKREVPDEVAQAYGVEAFTFGRDYIIPKPFDSRVLIFEASAVAEAAINSGVAKRHIDIEEYRQQLDNRIGRGRIILNLVTNKAKKDPKIVVYPEGDSLRILRAAHVVRREHIANPILLGSPEEIHVVAREHDIDLTGIQIIDPITSDQRQRYAERLTEKRARKGVTKEIAVRMVRDSAYFGLMMLETGDCDTVLTGVTMEYPESIRPALQIIGLQPGISRASGLMALIRNDKVYMFADTTVNIDPTPEELAEIALCAAYIARAFDIQPRIAMLSFSNFGSAVEHASKKVALATEIVKKRDPELIVDGEMQADAALLPDFLNKYYPFSKLKEEANVLVFPDLNSGNIGYKLVKILGNLRAIGPILMGLSKPVHVLHRSMDINEIVDMTSIAVVNAQMVQRRLTRNQLKTVP